MKPDRGKQNAVTSNPKLLHPITGSISKQFSSGSFSLDNIIDSASASPNSIKKPKALSPIAHIKQPQTPDTINNGSHGIADLSSLRPQTKQTKRLSKMNVAAPSAETTLPIVVPMMKKAVIPAIKKVVESDLNNNINIINSNTTTTTKINANILFLSTKKIPIVLKFRDGTRVKLSFPADRNLVECVRDKLIHKYGRVKGSQMAIFTHGSKLSSNEGSPVMEDGFEVEESTMKSHSSVRLDSEELCGLTVWDVFDESGGLVFVE